MERAVSDGGALLSPSAVHGQALKAQRRQDTQRFFSLSDRIGRLRYFGYTLIAMVACGFVLVAIYLLALLLPAPMGKLIADSSFILVKNVVVPMIVFIMSIRRLHDLDASGWWTLTILIPFVTLILLAWPGQRETNRFGPPPPPNPSGLIMATLILPMAVLSLYFYMVKINANMKNETAVATPPAVSSKSVPVPLRSYDTEK